MGSFPGELGSSGKQVHSFAPLRSTGGSAPSLAGQSRMVASLEMDGGAALLAFGIFHAEVLPAAAGRSPRTRPPPSQRSQAGTRTSEESANSSVDAAPFNRGRAS